MAAPGGFDNVGVGERVELAVAVIASVGVDVDVSEVGVAVGGRYVILRIGCLLAGELLFE